MNAQVPYTFPFSVIDYGLTALALLCMAAMAYFFTKLASSQHKTATEAFDKMTDLLEDLTNITREVANEMQATKYEMARVNEELWRNRELINRGLDAADEATQIGRSLQNEAAKALYEEQKQADARARSTEKHHTDSAAAHEEHRDWEDARRSKENEKPITRPPRRGGD